MVRLLGWVQRQVSSKQYSHCFTIDNHLTYPPLILHLVQKSKCRCGWLSNLGVSSTSWITHESFVWFYVSKLVSQHYYFQSPPPQVHFLLGWPSFALGAFMGEMALLTTMKTLPQGWSVVRISMSSCWRIILNPFSRQLVCSRFFLLGLLVWSRPLSRLGALQKGGCCWSQVCHLW